MGRPLTSKVVTTLKPRIPLELEETLSNEFGLFKTEMENNHGLAVTQSDFLNYIIIQYLKEKRTK